MPVGFLDKGILGHARRHCAGWYLLSRLSNWRSVQLRTFAAEEINVALGQQVRSVATRRKLQRPNRMTMIVRIRLGLKAHARLRWKGGLICETWDL